MKETQRIIKYIAMAFAIFLASTIVFSIIAGISSIDFIFNGNGENITTDLTSYNLEDNDLAYLDINIKSANLIIKKGDNLLVETNNKYISVRQDQNRVSITEKNHGWFNAYTGDLIVYIPSDLLFDETNIGTGAGKITINTLNTKKLRFELGAGKVEIETLNVTNEATIHGGAGSITINNGILNNADFELGVGEFQLTSILNGDTSIESGVGSVTLNIVGLADNYKFKVDKGIGSVNVNGTELGDNSIYGTGTQLIDLDGGIGSIKVKFIND